MNIFTITDWHGIMRILCSVIDNKCCVFFIIQIWFSNQGDLSTCQYRRNLSTVQTRCHLAWNVCDGRNSPEKSLNNISSLSKEPEQCRCQRYFPRGEKLFRDKLNFYIWYQETRFLAPSRLKYWPGIKKSRTGRIAIEAQIKSKCHYLWTVKHHLFSSVFNMLIIWLWVCDTWTYALVKWSIAKKWHKTERPLKKKICWRQLQVNPDMELSLDVSRSIPFCAVPPKLLLICSDSSSAHVNNP